MFIRWKLVYYTWKAWMILKYTNHLNKLLMIKHCKQNIAERILMQFLSVMQYIPFLLRIVLSLPLIFYSISSAVVFYTILISYSLLVSLYVRSNPLIQFDHKIWDLLQKTITLLHTTLVSTNILNFVKKGDWKKLKISNVESFIMTIP